MVIEQRGENVRLDSDTLAEIRADGEGMIERPVMIKKENPKDPLDEKLIAVAETEGMLSHAMRRGQ